MTDRKVSIAMAQGLWGSTVKIDGVDLGSVLKGFTLEAQVDERCRLTLDVVPEAIDVIGDVAEIVRSLPGALSPNGIRSSVIKIEPGDVLVVEVPGIITCEIAERIKASMEDLFPGHKCAVFDQGTTLKVATS